MGPLRRRRAGWEGQVRFPSDNRRGNHVFAKFASDINGTLQMQVVSLYLRRQVSVVCGKQRVDTDIEGCEPCI